MIPGSRLFFGSGALARSMLLPDRLSTPPCKPPE
jgi:hypothetical protein